MSQFPPNSESAYSKATLMGLVVVTPEPNQLQIDIDSDVAYAVYKQNLETLKQFFPVASIEEHPSKSGGEKRHVTITLIKPVMSNMERILLQACLGSDGIRELLSYVQVFDPHPILFLENPVTVAMLSPSMPTPIERQLPATT